MLGGKTVRCMLAMSAFVLVTSLCSSSLPGLRDGARTTWRARRKPLKPAHMLGGRPGRCPPTHLLTWFHDICASLSIARSAGRNEDEEDEDDGEEVNRWNLRKCSAAGLDVLATVFADELLPITLPIINERLREDDWRAREVRTSAS